MQIGSFLASKSVVHLLVDAISSLFSDQWRKHTSKGRNRALLSLSLFTKVNLIQQLLLKMVYYSSLIIKKLEFQFRVQVQINLMTKIGLIEERLFILFSVIA